MNEANIVYWDCLKCEVKTKKEWIEQCAWYAGKFEANPEQLAEQIYFALLTYGSLVPEIHPTIAFTEWQKGFPCKFATQLNETEWSFMGMNISFDGRLWCCNDVENAETFAFTESLRKAFGEVYNYVKGK